MRDQFGGAIFEGVLLGAAAKTRGSAFGTGFLPIYDPLNASNIMYFEPEEQEQEDLSNKKCCEGTNPSCKGCDTCGTR